MTDILRQRFLDAHNHYRNEAAAGRLTGNPSDRAVNLPAMTWSTDLEKNSQAYVNLCFWGHSWARGWRGLEDYFGENLYISSGTQLGDLVADKALESWTNE